MPATIIETNTKPFNRVNVDPITLDIVENALRNARNEMDAVLFRTAMSPGIREQHDEFPMIANQEGKMVVGQFGCFLYGFIAGYRRHDRGWRHLPHQRSLQLRRRDQPSERLAADDADLPRGQAGQLGRHVRPHDRRRRQGARLAADRRQDDLRGRHHRAADEDLPEGQARRRDPQHHAAQHAHAGVEQVGLLRHHRGTAPGRAPRAREHRPLRRRLLHLRHVGHARPQQAGHGRDHQDDHPGSQGRQEGLFRGLDRRRRHGQRPVQDRLLAAPRGRDRLFRLHRQRSAELLVDQLPAQRRDVQDVLRSIHDQPLRSADPVQRRLLRPRRRPHSRRLDPEAEEAGGAVLPHAHARPHLRPDGRPARPGRARRAQRRRLLRQPALHVFGLRPERASGTSSSRSASAACPGVRPATARTDTRCGRPSPTCRTSSSRAYFPLRIREYATIPDSGGAGLHRGGNGIVIAYEITGAGRILDPRRPLADLSLGRQRRRAGPALDQAPGPHRRHRR